MASFQDLLKLIAKGGQTSYPTLSTPDQLLSIEVIPPSGCKYPMIYTIAGDNTGVSVTAPSDGADAINIQFGRIRAVEFYNGKLYFSDQQQNRIWSLTTDGKLHLVAGTGTNGTSGDGGPATAANISGPYGLAIDKRTGILYFSGDPGPKAIRSIDLNTGIINRYAGIYNSPGSSGDGGPAIFAKLAGPQLLKISGNKLYIPDIGFGATNPSVRVIDLDTGIITRVAGNGSFGYSGENVDPVTSAITDAWDVDVDSKGNIFIYEDHRIRIIKAATGLISTYAGSDSSSGYTGDGGPATSALIGFEYGIAIDSNDNLYIVDNDDGVIRKIDSASGIISTFAFSGYGSPIYGDCGAILTATVNNPRDMVFDPATGDIFIADEKLIRYIPCGGTSAYPHNCTP